jgi:hypothetical protein
MATLALEKPRYAIKGCQPFNTHPMVAGILFQGCPTNLEQRVHCLDYRHTLGLLI